MNKQLTVRLATPSVVVQERKQRLTLQGIAAPSPTSRAFPAFSKAIAHGDPHNLIALAEDVPGTRGNKRIVTNRAAVDTRRLPDCAWWIWPWEDVGGWRPSDPTNLEDLRRWEGRSWMEVVEDPTETSGIANARGWYCVAGFLHGSAPEAEFLALGGLGWVHPWSWFAPALLFPGSTGQALIQGSATNRGEARVFELGWRELVFPTLMSVAARGPGGAPLDSWSGGGTPQAGAPGSAPSWSRRPGEPLHLVFAVGLVGGDINENRGLPDEWTVRAAHSFRRKRY